MQSAELFQRIPEFRATLEEEGFLSLEGVESLDDDQLTRFAESFSDQPEGSPKLLAWDFGTIMRMRYDPEAANYLFSSEVVPLHWDGAFHQEPRYLLFFCDESSGAEGETVFVDTEAILADLDPATIEAWKKVTLTYSTEKKAHYGGQFSTFAVRPHPFHGRDVLRFAEAVATDKNPVQLEIEGAEPSFYQELEALVTNPKYRYAHRWSPGDVILVDNHSYLHGRNPLGANTGRAFRRIQVL